MAAPERAGVARLLRLLPEAAALTRAADGLLLDANEAFEELTAYRRDELLGRVVYELGLWGDPELWERLVQEAGTTGEARSGDTQLRAKDGRLISALVSVRCVALDGESCCLTTVRDLTEYKQAEEALRLEQQRLQFVLAGGQQGFWDWNIQTGEVQRNERWAEMLGYTLEEIEFTVAQWTDLIHPDDRDRAWQSIQDHLEGRSSAHRCEYRMRTKQGDYRWILDQAMIVQRDPQGHPLRMSGTHTDITERRRMEDALRDGLARERLLADLVRYASVAIGVGYPDGRLGSLNPAFCELTGYTEDELKTVDWNLQLTPPEWREHESAKLRELARTKQPVRYEKEYLRKDGSRVPVELVVHPRLGAEGTVEYYFAFVTDITERKRAEEEVTRLNRELERLVAERTAQLDATIGELEEAVAEGERAEERFRTVADFTADWEYWVGPDREFLYVSPSCEPITGYQPSEFVQDASLADRIIHSDDWPAYRAEHLRFHLSGEAAREEAPEVEFRIMHKAGEVRWIGHLCRPVFGRDGQFLGRRSSNRDITGRKEAEAELAAKREELDRYFDGSLDLIAIGDTDGYLRRVNPAWKSVLGYPPQELEGRPFLDLLHPDDRPASHEAIARLSEQREVLDFVTRLRTKAGAYRWIEWRAYPVGQIVYAMGRDVTERRDAEQALRASEAAYRELVEDINDVIYATDHSGVLTYISPAVERVLGYAPADVVGQSVESLVHPDEVTAVQRRFADLAAGRLTVNEYRVFTKNREVRWVRVSSRPTIEGGVLVGVRGVLADITDWKQAQEEARRLQAQLLQSQKLAALGEVIAGIAHELNNPLAAVVAYAQLMQERELPREAADDASAVTESALRASRVVQNLLAFARRQEPRRTPTAVNEVVEDVLQLRAAHLAAGGIEVVAQLAPDLPRVLADRHQLEQVLLNLVNNAERALLDTHDRRQLTLATETAGDWLQVRVADTGVGIPEDLLDRIFEPFFTTRAAGQGTGLGLAICHAIVSDHGGRISVSSRLGEGTEFLVELPVTAEPPVAEAPEAQPVTSFAGLRALVVEDELLVRLPLVRMMEEMGLEVASAGDAEAALRILTGGDYGIVVCDMKMPGMDGRAFHDEVRRRWPPLARRFIICTGDVLNPDTVAFAEAIGAPLLAKPFLAADVRAAVAAALAGNGPARRGSEAARP